MTPFDKLAYVALGGFAAMLALFAAGLLWGAFSMMVQQ